MTFKTHMTEDEMVHLRSKLDDLLELSEGLTNKQIEIICSLDEKWRVSFTTGQGKLVEDIWSQKFES